MSYFSFPQNVNNGAVGEDRTRAILSNDFYTWSIQPDVYGADHFVIKKDLKRGPMYMPRVAHVQSKFRQKMDSEIKLNFSHVFIEDKRLKETDTKGWRPNPLYFLYGHTGKLDEEVVYFLTARDIQEYCEVDYDKQTIIVNLHNVDRNCLFKEESKSKLQETLDIISEHIDEAETLDTSIISEQLKISANENCIEYQGKFYERSDDALPENIELMFKDLNEIKNLSISILKEIEPLVTTLRQLALETSTVSLEGYYSGINYELLKLDGWKKKIQEEGKQDCLLALVRQFYNEHFSILLDEV